jgi:alkylated DNA repair dioxygenase AlkB
VPRRQTSDPLPEGFLYQPEFISADDEAQLLHAIKALRFEAFQFQGYVARRRIVEYGFEYDFSTRRASAAPEIPEFLRSLQHQAATLANLPPNDIVEAVVTEYPPGAPIGWHRDVPQFEVIIGISFASSCRMRLKPYRREGSIVSVLLEPRSAYVMRGPARWKFQHSIPPVKDFRYSVTFRTLRVGVKEGKAA